MLPGAAVVGEPFAKKYHLKIGDTLETLIGSEWHELYVVGLIPNQLLAPWSIENLALVDIATAQEILGRAGYVDRIDLITSEKAAQELAAQLPAPLLFPRGG